MKNIINVGKREVGLGAPTSIIAEIGINHNGFVSVAKRMIEVAVAAGADAVKFQKRTIPVVYSPEELRKARQVDKTVLRHAIERGVLPDEAVDRLEKSNFESSTNGDLKWALEFTAAEYREIDHYCREKNVTWFASPWDEESVDFLEDLRVPLHKVASASVTDDGLLRYIRATGKPVIMSTGACNLPMIRYAASLLDAEMLALLHCTSFYVKPVTGGEAMMRMVNLKAIETLQAAFPDLPIGFSSHFSGIQPALAAVALGASIVETHITLERSMVGSDQASSLEPHEFTNLCRMIREYEVLRGDGVIHIYPEEVEVMKKLRRVWSPEQRKLFDDYHANGTTA